MPRSLSKSTTLVLVGSGEFTSSMKSIDRYLLSLSGSRHPTVAVIPTAAGQEADCYKWIDRAIRHFSRLGAQVVGLRILNHQEANLPVLVKPLNQANIIYFSGGDPGYLFSSIKDSLLWQQVFDAYQHGTFLIGSSAGAMILGKFLLANPYQVTNNRAAPKWIPAFNIAPYTVLPHYNYLSGHESHLFSVILSQVPPRIKHTLLGIDEDTALIIHNGNLKTLGSGFVQCPR